MSSSVCCVCLNELNCVCVCWCVCVFVCVNELKGLGLSKLNLPPIRATLQLPVTLV